MRIVRHSSFETRRECRRTFTWRDMPGAGFSFDSDEHGNVDIGSLNPAAKDNYEKCLSGEHDVLDDGVQVLTNSYRRPAVGLCECGEEVVLDGFTCPCVCGRDYNWAGQLLAPRSQWGEETGEHWTDCVGPFSEDRS
jgi:hypothetical protein